MALLMDTCRVMLSPVTPGPDGRDNAFPGTCGSRLEGTNQRAVGGTGRSLGKTFLLFFFFFFFFFVGQLNIGTRNKWGTRGAPRSSFKRLSFSFGRKSYRFVMTVWDPQISVSARAISSNNH